MLSLCSDEVCMCCSRRFAVYVCTAAERAYALEAWRLLDSQNNIIAQEHRLLRIVCVPSGRKKELRRVLGMQAPLPFRTGGYSCSLLHCCYEAVFVSCVKW